MPIRRCTLNAEAWDEAGEFNCHVHAFLAYTCLSLWLYHK
ncbi:hypothetical protein HMPREF1545_04255 [Oscillibacter sp. KLE 1728]|nr:hypothetical protein HMPREF1545_04255 [Oscillibacter sp. KLE 1728]ERK56726.1 hypothetical protein HMPREF1546_04060 [Oscillibacter sp. KLE 1745]